MNLNRLKKDEILWLNNHYCKHGHTFLAHLSCVEKDKPNISSLYEKIGFLDIEASNLKANWGIVMSYCIKELNGPMIKRVVTKDELSKKIYDRELMKDCIQDMRKFDKLVYFYGDKFDIPFLRTRAVLWGLDFPLYKEVKGQDVYPIIKYKFKLHSNRLETACDFFKIPSKGHRLSPEIWLNALVGDRTALDWIMSHNKEDVLSLEALYNKVINYVNNSNKSI